MRSTSSKHAFLGKSFTRFLILVVFATMMVITDKVLNYRFMVVQKLVQEGHVNENWHAYLHLAFWVIMISVVMRAVKVFFVMWTEKIQKINFFDTYNGVMQEDGKLKSSLKIFTIASAKVHCVIETAETLINIAYIIALMQVVTMTVPAYIGCGMILLSGIVIGYFRGNLQSKTDMLGAETQSLQEKLSNFFMISNNVLEERLNEIGGNYWKRIVLQCVKNTLQVLPDLVKVACFVALFYNITMMGMEEGMIYPHTYIVYATFGYMVSLASSISNLLEYFFKISQYKKDREVLEITEEMKLREKERKDNSEAVVLRNGFQLKKEFTLRLVRPNGDEAFYNVPEDLVIEEGTAILLEGENGTGKSRCCKFIKTQIPNCASYDTKTSIVEKYHENFKREKSSIDFNLIKYLAKGLMLERIPESKSEFFELECSQINSADRQMLVALQILYFAAKDFEEGNKQLVILDEIFGNLSFERTKAVLPFIMAELSKVKACTIVVSHTHKDEVKKYMSAIWQMRNVGREVLIESIPV